jgi:hypothetical protein
MDKQAESLREIDLSVGPHSARRDWRVVRINFNGRSAEQKAAVARAIRALYEPERADAVAAAGDEQAVRR